jgi:hypothetical protein
MAGSGPADSPLLPLDSRSTQLYSYPQSFCCFALMPQLAAVLYQVSGIIDFDGTGAIAADEVWSCRVGSSR